MRRNVQYQYVMPYGRLPMIGGNIYLAGAKTVAKKAIPKLEKLSNLKVNKDFGFAYCPERVNPGDIFWNSEKASEPKFGINLANGNSALNSKNKIKLKTIKVFFL